MKGGDINMKENLRSIAPKFRRGEVFPEVPAGKIVTRYHGELVFVSQKDEREPYFGNSSYTERQLNELRAMPVVPEEKPVKGFSGGVW